MFTPSKNSDYWFQEKQSDFEKSELSLTYSHPNETLINNQDQHSQTEYNETSWAESPNENDSEDTERNKPSAFP